MIGTDMASSYIKYDNGLTIQWGYVWRETSSKKTVTITFPISYKQTPALNATWITDSYYNVLMGIKSLSETQAEIRNDSGSATQGYTWMSIGWV